MDIEAKLRENMVKFLVQKKIFCGFTDEVLDYRTCTVLVDSDGDPADVYSPKIAEVLRNNSKIAESFAAKGYFLQD